MRNIGKIIRIARPLYNVGAIIIALIVVTAALDLVSPILFKYIVDGITAKLRGTGGNLNQIIFLVILSFLLGLLSNLMTAVSDRLGDHFAGRLRKFLTEKYYRKVLSLSQSYFDTELSGKIINQLNRGIVAVQDFINNASNFILPIILQSVFTIIIMLYYNVPVAIFTVLLFPIYIGISSLAVKKWGVLETEKNKIEDTIRSRITEVVNNIKLVKSFNSEKKEYDKVSTSLTESNVIYAKQSNTYHIYDFFRNLSLNVILTAVNVIIFINAFQGKMTLGTVVLLLQLMGQVRRPLFGMSFILESIQRAESGSKEFFEVLELPSKEQFETSFRKEIFSNPSLQFKDVSFRYDSSGPVLSSVDFTIAPREKVALVGHSGVGKTTIVNLILKFYAPSNGDILLDNRSYRDLDTRVIRDNIALVFQDSELFSSTVRENVAYGTQSSEKDIIRALKLANAYGFVMKLPKGLDSEVGERGVKLSGGQKQRIQVARAILKNSPILILDEATSSLDAKSEKEVQDALENLMKDKLVIIIAHRFSTIQNVNKIIVLDEGKVVDCGTPLELSKRRGIYSDLLNYQIEGNKKLLEQFEIY